MQRCLDFADNCFQVTSAATNGSTTEFALIEEEPQKSD